MLGTGGWSAVVLAGGRGRRLGGIDKPALVVGSRSLLDTVIAACSEAAQIVVVGPERPTSSAVGWTQESPAGSGPLAALSAGIGRIPAGVAVVVVLAADLPAVDAETVGQLVAALDASDADVVALADEAERVQPLVAAYRLPALRRALQVIGDVGGLPVGRLLDHLRLDTIADHGGAAKDIDTPQDLARWSQTPPHSPVDHGEMGHSGGY